MKFFARFILWLFGWKYKGESPTEKKAVIISVPHTSGWDFVWGKLSFMSYGVSTYILMKKEFFVFPLNYLFKWMNVLPVDRGNRDNHIVETMAKEFKKRDTMYLTITPEGSRKKRKKWKRGFLAIAMAANVPIYLGEIDYLNKRCVLGPLFVPTGDMDADMAYVKQHYKNAHPKHPENFSIGD